MQCAGFVLAGGGSRRMGQDKALLPWKEATLIEFVAEKVRCATGSATLIGDPYRFSHLGYPVISDLQPGCGPMGGLQTALRRGLSDWNLVTACDMPRLSVESLRALVEKTLHAPHERACFVPRTERGWHPLCAIYHVSCLPIVEHALAVRSLKMIDLLSSLRPVPVTLDPFALANVNTPEEWDAAGGRTL